MKTLLLVLCALLPIGAGLCQPIPLEDAIGPDKTYRDSKYDVAFKIPTLWEPISAVRWGKNARGENTVALRAPEIERASLGVYYQMFYADNPVPADAKTWFLSSAAAKQTQRRATGTADHRIVPESFVFRTIAGRPTCSYSATFTFRGEPMEEYFVRVLGKKGYVMLFATAPLSQIGLVKIAFDRMAETVVVP